MAIGRPSEMKLEEDARRIVLARKQQSDVKSKTPADEKNKQAGEANKAETGGAPVDYFPNAPKGLNFNQQGGPANNNQPPTSALALTPAGAAGQPGASGSPYFSKAEQALDRVHVTPRGLPEVPTDPDMQRLSKEQVQALSKLADEYRAEVEKGPDKVKDILDLKRVGILAGGALLAKLLGVNDGYIAEFVGGFLPAVQQEQEKREAKAQMEHQQKIAGLKSEMEARTGVLGATTSERVNALREWEARAQREQMQYGMDLSAAKLHAEAGTLHLNVGQAKWMADNQSLKDVRDSQEWLMKLLPSLTKDGVEAWVQRWNTLSAAHGEMLTRMGGKASYATPMIDNDMAKSIYKMVELKENALVTADSAQQLEYKVAAFNAILGLASQMRRMVFAPNQKVATEMIGATAKFIGEFVRSIPFESDEARQQFVMSFMPAIAHSWTTPTAEEAAYGLQRDTLNTEKFIKMMWLELERDKFNRESDLAILKMGIQAAGTTDIENWRDNLVINAVKPALQALLSSGVPKLAALASMVQRGARSAEILVEVGKLLPDIESERQKAVQAGKEELAKQFQGLIDMAEQAKSVNNLHELLGTFDNYLNRITGGG